jgi:hypothetical protein
MPVTELRTAGRFPFFVSERCHPCPDRLSLSGHSFMSVDCLKRRRYAALVGLGRPSGLGDEGEAAHHFTARFRHPHDAENTARMGDKAKPLAAYRRRLCCLRGHRDASIERRCDEGHSALPGLMLCCGRIVVPDGAHAHLGVANGDPSFCSQARRGLRRLAVATLSWFLGFRHCHPALLAVVGA